MPITFCGMIDSTCFCIQRLMPDSLMPNELTFKVWSASIFWVCSLSRMWIGCLGLNGMDSKQPLILNP